ncbi:MAG: hypothetical protein REJ50_08905 [Bordetella sp.]|nr:hypothetical protein [Bordetella sp.]
MSMPIPGRRPATGWRPHAPLALRSGQAAVSAVSALATVATVPDALAGVLAGANAGTRAARCRAPLEILLAAPAEGREDAHAHRADRACGPARLAGGRHAL